MGFDVAVDARPRSTGTVVTTPANEADVEVVDELLRRKDSVAYADAGYTGADKRVPNQKLRWEIARRRGQLQKLPEGRERQRIERQEHAKASIRAKVEHPFRVIKRQFGYVKVRFKGLAKNTAQIVTLFALANLWMARKKLLAMTGELRPQFANGV